MFYTHKMYKNIFDDKNYKRDVFMENDPGQLYGGFKTISHISYCFFID
jgi:hypothetical protein